MEHIIDLFGLNIFLFGNIYRYKDNTHTYWFIYLQYLDNMKFEKDFYIPF